MEPTSYCVIKMSMNATSRHSSIKYALNIAEISQSNMND